MTKKLPKTPQILTLSKKIVAPKGATPPPALDPALAALLAAEPVLCAQLKEALACGRWLVTVHWKIKDSPPDDLMHTQTNLNFPVAEMRSSMDFVKTMLPEAETAAPAAKDWR